MLSKFFYLITFYSIIKLLKISTFYSSSISCHHSLRINNLLIFMIKIINNFSWYTWKFISYWNL